MCNLQCPSGMTVNGKDGVTKKKLICKCGSKCKWKNEKNKKISRATYQGWTCEGTPDVTTTEPTITDPTTGDETFQALTDSIVPGLEVCGMAGGTKIVNGVQTEQNSWPWIVEFFMRDAPGSNRGYTCGGTIIAEHWVITGAAHNQGEIYSDIFESPPMRTPFLRSGDCTGMRGRNGQLALTGKRQGNLSVR